VNTSLLAIAASLLMTAAAHAAATPAQKCEAGKNGTAGKYAACLHKVQQKFVSGGEVDTARRDAAILSHTYRPGTSICFVSEGAKPREVFAADFRDRKLR
jgi:hypothetical protein